MYSPRRPCEMTFPAGIRRLVAGLFGILAMAILWHLAAEAQLPGANLALLLLGGAIVAVTWGQALICFIQAAGRQQFPDYETTTGDPRPQPRDAGAATSILTCSSCATPLQPRFRYCPHCGRPV